MPSATRDPFEKGSLDPLKLLLIYVLLKTTARFPLF
jgi:hypothetical protein